MIKVIKNLADVPPGLTSEKSMRRRQEVLTEKSTHQFDRDIYNQGCVEVLIRIYQNKCGFCESNPSAGSYWHVEHFRPKKGVANVKNHLGYYWLGYEWSNLILSCERCNKKKGNKFPISDESRRIIAPILDNLGLIPAEYYDISSVVFSNEQAILISPEIDAPEEHFIFKPNGEIKELTGRALETIKICDLNRENLVLARRKILDDFFDAIKEALKQYINNTIDENVLIGILENKFSEIYRKQSSQTEYSRVWFFLREKFQLFVNQFINAPHSNLVSARFEIFKQKMVFYNRPTSTIRFHVIVNPKK